MKQLNEFKNWADSVLNEFAGSPSKKEKAPISAEKDIARQSQTKYAGYDKEQALELFISDKLDDMEKRDLEQNKVINIQRRENDKLRKELTTLGQEVHDTVDASQQDHREIERLRALAGQAKSDVETRQAGRGEIEALLKQVEELRNKPGVSSEQYIELKKKIENNVKDGVSPQKLKELEKKLETANSGDRIKPEDIQRLSNEIDRLKASNSNSVSKQEINNLLSQIEGLKNKPGVSIEQYNQLKQQVEVSAKSGVDPQKLQKLETQIQKISNQREVGVGQLKRLKTMADDLTIKQTQLAGTERELAKKVADLESRHSELIDKEQKLDAKDAERQGRFEEYKEKFANFGNRVNSRLDQIEPEVRTAKELAADVGDELDTLQSDFKHEQIAQNQYIQKHEKELDRLSVGDYSPIPRIGRVPPEMDATRDVNSGIDAIGDYAKYWHKKSSSDNHVYRDATSFILELDNIAKSLVGRATNILAPLDVDGKPKNKNEKLSDIKKTQQLLFVYKNNLIKKFRAVVDSGTKDEEELKNTATAYNKLFNSSLDVIADNSSIPKRRLSTELELSSIDYDDDPDVRDGLTSMRHDGLTSMRHLPESIQQKIDQLADDILGPQYSKYLK